MPRIRLVRHGQAAAGFSDDHDPGLSDLGRTQSVAMTTALRPTGPRPIVVSPLRRTVETAAPLADAWAVTPTIDRRVAEIPSPTDDLAERGAWLSQAMAGTWADLGPELEAWRNELLDAVLELDDGTVVVSHFIAINALIGVAVGDDRVMHVPLANCSITTLDTEPSARRLAVVALGVEAITEVI